MHKSPQYLNLIRSRDKVSKQFLVEPRSSFEEPSEGFFARHGRVAVDDAVVFEELETDFGLEVERGGAFEEDLFVCFGGRYFGGGGSVLGFV